MSINFLTIPQGIKNPGVLTEIVSRDGILSENDVILVVGQSRNAVPVTPTVITSVEQAMSLYGAGSDLHLQIEKIKQNNSAALVKAVPLIDVVAGVAAVGTVTFSGLAANGGTHSLYINGTRYQVGLTPSTTATAAAAAFVTAINADIKSTVTASSLLGVLTLTAKHKGEYGNAIDVRVNHFAETGDEKTPLGTTVVIAPMSTGATNPDLSTAYAAIGDMFYTWFTTSITDTATLNLIQANMADRYTYNKKLYSRAVLAKNGTVSALITFGSNRDDKFTSIYATTGIPLHPSQVSAAVVGALANAYSADPAANTNTVQVLGLMPPRTTDALTWSDHQNLLSNQMATLYFQGGVARIKRDVTTSKTNDSGFPDDSYEDGRTLVMAARILRDSESMMTTKFARAKLAADGTQFGTANIVTPKTIKGEFLALYNGWVDAGICQNVRGFLEFTVVELDPIDPSRVNIKLAVTFTNALYVTALQLAFSLRA